MKNRYLIATIVMLIITGFNLVLISVRKAETASAQSLTQTVLKRYTPQELKKYDGSDPGLPIYIALNGDVYDVTAGKEFYQTGGPYHYLAGRDSSVELNLIGGSIIKSKYPVIGQLSPGQ